MPLNASRRFHSNQRSELSQQPHAALSECADEEVQVKLFPPDLPDGTPDSGQLTNPGGYREMVLVAVK
ncbi:hypothetical protein Y032_0002g878 [Ancylostoma ceylanicum]|uniref:Uncharacterized protein n=1 Tax=Ancylostoma ceylanicum TaxID=53326 RepID=A0A016W2U3_9BILA|nr:hypothetical protein Y032_0002g878 [Ancylostoma ceylanicum]